MKSIITLTFFSLLLFQTACGFPGFRKTRDYITKITYNEANPASPFKRIKKIAIMPHLNFQPGRLSKIEFSHILATEMKLFDGFQVVPEVMVEEARLKSGIVITGPEGYRELGEFLEVDAVIVVYIHDYQQQPTPILKWELQVYPVKFSNYGMVDIQTMTSVGLEAHASLKDRKAPLIGFTLEFNYDDKRVKAKLAGYGASHNASERGLGVDAFAFIPKSYIKFCSNETIRYLIKLEKHRAEQERLWAKKVAAARRNGEYTQVPAWMN